MHKIKLQLDNLVVESFTVAAGEGYRGTVVGNSNPTNGPHCGSAFDACQTGLCTGDCEPTYSPDACPTEYPEYC